MRREVAIAVLAATLLGPGVEAQMRSAARIVARPAGSRIRTQPVRTSTAGPGMVAPRPAFVTRSRVGHSGFIIITPGFRHRHHRFVFTSGCFDPFFNPLLCQQTLFASPVILPIVWPDVSQASPPPPQTTATPYEPDSDLRADIDRLTEEVEMLRQEQQARNIPQQPPSTTTERATPTVLVFRDGHRTEVRNYGIVGETLWVFTERQARKIPLAELDLKGTQRVNAERGVEFPPR